MIDALNLNTRLTMAEAAALVGKTVQTVYGWARPTDYRGRPRRHVLETVRLGGTIYTSRWALRRFQDRTDWRRWYRKRKSANRRKRASDTVFDDRSDVAIYVEYLQAITGLTFPRIPIY